MTVTRVEGIDPGSREDLFNRADPHCELCNGLGQRNGVACWCVRGGDGRPGAGEKTGGPCAKEQSCDGPVASAVSPGSSSGGSGRRRALPL